MRTAESGIHLAECAVGHRAIYYPFVPKKEECARKIALLNDVRSAMAALMAIHEDEVQMLLQEDFDGLAELRTKLDAARARKTSLVELYREHVISHGC